ncbi:MAG: DNA methyltransferase [Calditrichaeota bacterium]|nr:MAG: DNA methyltransferase [Calditrichota bacterium]
MPIQNYLEKINTRFKSGISREHSYRSDLEILIRELIKGIEITNEPSNVTDCGNPDYVITKGKIPIGYIEAKDIGKDLKSKQYKEQFTRYRKALDNLIITDYLKFQFFQNGDLVHEIKIGEIEEELVKPIPENFEEFKHLLQNFCSFLGQSIKSSKKLAEMMAAKARLLKDILERALNSDEKSQENSSLKEQFNTFKAFLIHDLKTKEFADIYAQTLAYGMFAARLHDTSLNDFSRQEAAELIPKSNPFLRKLFGYVAGPDIDERIKRTVDNLAEVFRATNVEELLKSFGKSTQTNDPMIHFYETFLAEYDPKLRKSRGVWYTPEPVVNFIVRAVDEILKTEFELKQGLADISKTKIKVPIQGSSKNKMQTKEVHKVQILDPATGTGTFLAEVIKNIYHQNFKKMQGAWNGYVEEHLIPRLNGFELLMASYSMAHLKLDMLLTETGYKPKKNQRLNIYLTNSLEENHPDTGTIFASWLSNEANEANHIKRDNPVMCIIGNPPYLGESKNKGDWIMKIMEDYKKEPGGKQKLQERNPKWINDDYVKFMRFAQFYIEKNGEGILAFINPHGFLDNPTFRGMRWNLLRAFDKIYTIDLHGNSKKKEVSPDGSIDQNVFDIMQGVSINIFVKETKSKTLAQVFHFDLYGKRNKKYEFLNKNSLKTIAWNELQNVKPNFYFVPKDFDVKKNYDEFISIIDLFQINSVGVATSRDHFTIHETKEEVISTIQSFLELENEVAREKFKLGNDVRDWKIEFAKADLIKSNCDFNNITTISYRPFENKKTYFTGKSKGFHCMPRGDVMKHFFKKDNLGLVLGRQGLAVGQMTWNLGFITKFMTDLNIYRRGGGNTFPLYLYSDKEDLFSEEVRKPNLDLKLVTKIAKKVGLKFTNEKEETEDTFAPIDILDYIYAVLHSPTYREKYKEFLKIDFPRIPFPKSTKIFWELVKLGGELRQIHLLESSKVEEFITTYPQDGDNVITRKLTAKSPGFQLTDEQNKLGKVWINEQQYFDKVPLVAWEFYIGGYQPAQKWLKDRSPKGREEGRKLNFEDILHYQKIIVALTETDRLMKEIDKIEVE